MSNIPWINLPSIFDWGSGLGEILNLTDWNFWELEAYANYYVAPIVNSHEASINALWQRVGPNLEPRVTALEQDMDTIWWQVYSNIVPVQAAHNARLKVVEQEIAWILSIDLVNIYRELDVMWGIITGAIEPAIANLLDDVNDLYKIVDSELRPNIDILFDEVDGIWNIVDSELRPNINTLFSVTNDIWSYLNTEISTAIDAVESRVTDIEQDIRDTIKPAIGDLESALGALQGYTQNEITRVEALIAVGLEGLSQEITDLAGLISDDLFVPLSLLSTVLTDSSGAYTNYRDYWQQFAVKILG